MNDQLQIIRRYLECAAFVLLWMVIHFHLKIVGRLAVDVALVAAFQLFVARRPLVQLWVRDAETLPIDRWTLALASGLALAGGLLVWSVSGHHAPLLGSGPWFYGLLVLGAVPAAIALRQQRAAALRSALPFLFAVVILRIGWDAAWHGGQVMIPAAKLGDFAATWVSEFLDLFVIDEVAFRGALDPHLAAAGRGRLHAACSAIFVSVLWSLWHLPTYSPHASSFLALFATIGPFVLFQIAQGVLLSFAARAARTLAPTSAVHAFSNAHVLAFMK